MINLENVSKKFGTGVFGLSDITFAVEKGEFVFLVGPTGSGKTTIFKLLIREMYPTQGTIVVDSWDLVKLPSKQVPELRKKIGVVFQDLKLLTDRTIFENIILPLDIAGVNEEESGRRVEEVLERVGIIEHRDKFPIQLSGGELQRTAIARALILSPDIILADEPTGDLDEATAWDIVKLLSEINEGGTTVIMATHNADIVKKMDKRIIELSLGSIVNDKKTKPKHKKKEEEKDEKPKEKKEVHEEARKDDKKESEKGEDKGKKPITDEFEKALEEE